jgi:hypothetical protein
LRRSESQRGEAELAALFQSYERALQVDREVAREILLGFFDRLAAAAASWRPDPAAILAARAAAASVAERADAGGGGGSGRAQLHLVKGCSGGHPRALLAAAVECLEQAPRELLLAAAAPGLEAGGWAQQGTEGETAGSPAEPVEGAGPSGSASSRQLALAGGLPALRALRVLLRSQHNRAVLAGLGLLPALCALARQLAQKLQAAAGVLALRSGDALPPLAGTSSGAGSSPVSPSSQPALGAGRQGDGPLEALLLLLQAALAAAQAYAQHEADHQQRAALLAARGASKAASHAAQAAAQAAAAAAAGAAAGAASAAAVAPLLEQGLVLLCCELLPVVVQVRLRLGEGASPQRPPQQQQQQQQQRARVLAAAAALERRALLCLLAMLAASPVPAATALVQQRGGRGMELVVGCLGWPLAPAAQQLPPSAAAGAGDPGDYQPVGGSSLADAHARVWRGGGLRPAAQELQVQLLALRALGAALRSGAGAGPACLRRAQQLGCLPRLTQLLQWAALTFDDAGSCLGTSGDDDAGSSPGAVPPPGSPGGGAAGGSELAQLFAVLWSWLAGVGGAAAAALPPAVLAAVLAAFRPLDEPPGAAGSKDEAAPAGSAPGDPARMRRSPSPTAAEQPLELSAAVAASAHTTAPRDFHERALAALRGVPGAAGCGCALQQQAALLAARLLGREARLAPLLPPAACPQPDGQHLQAGGWSGGGGLQSSGGGWAAGPGAGGSEAASNLQAVRAAGEPLPHPGGKTFAGSLSLPRATLHAARASAALLQQFL